MLIHSKILVYDMAVIMEQMPGPNSHHQDNRFKRPFSINSKQSLRSHDNS